MTSIRTDARRVFDARRERAATNPARLAAPALSTGAVVGVTVAVLLVAGAGFPLVAAAVAVVAIVAAGTAHRTTASVCAGLTLWLIRPYRAGERVRLYLPEVGRAVVAEIVRIGLLNTTLVAESGVVVIANTRLLRAAPECRGR